MFRESEELHVPRLRAAALPVRDGVARLEVSSEAEDEDDIVVEMSGMPNGDGVLFSSEVGDIDFVDDLRPLLEANHSFSETAGTTLSLEDGIIYFERYVPFSAIGRFGGASTVKAFVASALEWRRRIDNMDEDDGVQQFDGLTVGRFADSHARGCFRFGEFRRFRVFICIFVTGAHLAFVSFNSDCRKSLTSRGNDGNFVT